MVSAARPSTPHLSEEQIWAWLEDVPDPEIPVLSVVDLGIVRSVTINDDVVKIVITPTYSGCPAMRVIALDIETALSERGVEHLELHTRIAPAWTTGWMSQKGRARLEEFGIAPPRAAGGPERCPRCRSGNVQKISQFGSTPCKAQWRCRDCLEPFDYFKCI